MNQPFAVELVQSPHQMEAVKALRVRVFVEEQRVPLDEEFDEYDDAAIHAIAVSCGKIVGTGRMFSIHPGEAYIGRMAVEQSYRRKGVGSQILLFLEVQAKVNGINTVKLHAQTYVKSFYEQRGYVVQGKPFMEVDIEHILMTKKLQY